MPPAYRHLLRYLACSGIHALRCYAANPSKAAADRCVAKTYRAVIAALRAQPHFLRRSGRDHFMILGRCMQWDFSRTIPAARDLRHVWLLGIETNCVGSSLAIPYPTGIHVSTPSQLAQHREAMLAKPREHLACYYGSLQSQKHNFLRERMAEECAGDLRCVMALKEMGAGGEDGPDALFSRCSFCLQPRGDTRTRKSIWDGIALGCVPVFFEASVFDDYRALLVGPVSAPAPPPRALSVRSRALSRSGALSVRSCPCWL